MFLKVIFVLSVVLEFVFVPLFLKYSWPQKCLKSLRYKMICSTLFMIAGFAAMQISGNSTSYAKLIMLGLFFGWLGDLFLHLITDKIYIFGIGLFAFLGGHIFYIAAFSKAIHKLQPDAPTFAWFEILAIILIVGLMAAYVLVKKIRAKVYMAIPVAMYAVTISAMLVKACTLSYYIWNYSMANEHVLPMILLIVGAVFFVLSDATLGLILFGGQDKNRPLKWFNIGTYFAAQILLASTIFCVTSAVPLA